MADKIQSLVEYLNSDDNLWSAESSVPFTESDVVIIDDKTILTPQGEFLVLTDEEAHEREKENLEELLECNNYDVTVFRPYDNYVKDNFIKDTDKMREFMHDDYEGYYLDIKSESAVDSFFTSRCQQELYESQIDDETALKTYKEYTDDLEHFRDLDSEEEFECVLRNILESKSYMRLDDNGKFIVDGVNFVDICNWLNDDNRDMSIETLDKMQELYFEEEYDGCEDDIEKLKDWFLNYEDNEDELIEKAIDKSIDGYDDGYEWLTLNFGNESVEYHLERGNLEFDYDGMATYFIDELGVGKELSGYDGKCNEYNGFNIVKVDDFEKEYYNKLLLEQREKNNYELDDR